MENSTEETFRPEVKAGIVGVGGAGGNALHRMIQTGIRGVDFIAVDKDPMVLDFNKAGIRIHIDKHISGFGSSPQMGYVAMVDKKETLYTLLKDSELVFIVAGLGGGTGTGAAPVIAEITRDLGILSIGVVTTPFSFEGPVCERTSNDGLDKLKKAVDLMLVIPHQKLLAIIEKTSTLREAFKLSDELLTAVTRSILEILPGALTMPFADIKAFFSQSGDANMGFGVGIGENRALEAAKCAVNSPLLVKHSINGAYCVIVNIAGGEDLRINEICDVMGIICQSVGAENDTNILFSPFIDPSLGDKVKITYIVIGNKLR